MKEARKVVFLHGWKKGRMEPLTMCFTEERGVRNARYLLTVHPEFEAIELVTPGGESVQMIERVSDDKENGHE